MRQRDRHAVKIAREDERAAFVSTVDLSSRIASHIEGLSQGISSLLFNEFHLAKSPGLVKKGLQRAVET